MKKKIAVKLNGCSDNGGSEAKVPTTNIIIIIIILICLNMHSGSCTFRYAISFLFYYLIFFHSVQFNHAQHGPFANSYNGIH